MSKITIQCKLIAPESTRHQLWQLMVEKNTPLINELLRQLAEHPDLQLPYLSSRASLEDRDCIYIPPQF